MFSALLRKLTRPFRPARLDIAWVTPDWAVGAAPAPGSLTALVREGISSVLDLRDEATPDVKAFASKGLRLLHLPVPDGYSPTMEEFAQGIEWVRGELAAERRVLICCQAGQGRSVTMACALLVALGYPLDRAFALVAKYRTVARPTEAQVVALKVFAKNRPFHRRRPVEYDPLLEDRASKDDNFFNIFKN